MVLNQLRILIRQLMDLRGLSSLVLAQVLVLPPEPVDFGAELVEFGPLGCGEALQA